MPGDEEDSEGYDTTNPEIQNMGVQSATKERLDNTLTTQSANKNATLLAEYLDATELETMAQCFDNIRDMRRTNPKMVGNDDNTLGD